MRSLEFSAALLEATFGFDGIARMREAGAAAVRLETNPASPWYPLARTVFGAALYYCGEFDQAAAQAEQARRSNTPIALVRMNAFALSALAAVDAGRNAQAQEFARRARDIATDPDQGLSGVPQTVMAHVASGAVLAARGRLPEARAEFEDTLRARRAWAGISPWPTVELLLTLAPVLGGLGDRAEAGARLDEARRLLTELPDGADHQLARLERLERQLAGRSRAASPTEPLTERERAVLRLFQGNITLREIGSELYLSQNTVKTHAQAIYRKLGWTCITATVAGQPGFYRLLDQFQDFALQVVSINQLSPLAADPRPASW